jgi:hypothetical protein
VGLVGGIIIGLITAALAIASMGAGHGSYVYAKLFYPFAIVFLKSMGEIPGHCDRTQRTPISSLRLSDRNVAPEGQSTAHCIRSCRRALCRRLLGIHTVEE